MKTVKKFISIITVAIMLFGIFVQNSPPTSVYAEEPSKPPAISNAAKRLEAGKTGKKVYLELDYIRVKGGKHIYKKDKGFVDVDDNPIYYESGSYKYKSDNTVVPDNKIPKMKKGDELDISYKWDIKNISGIKTGDYFRFKLPKTDELKYLGRTDGILKNNSDPTNTIGKIGDFYIHDNYVWMVLSNPKVLKSPIKDGTFNFYGKVEKDNTGIDIKVDETSSITIPTPNNPPSGPPPVTPPGTPPNMGKTEDDYVKFFKWGKSSGAAGSKRLEWGINVNKEQLKEMIAGGPVTPRTDLVLEDTIPKGLKFDKEKIRVESLIYVPKDSDTTKMSKDVISYPRLAETSHNSSSFIHAKPIDVLEQNPGESYDDFKQRVIATAKTPAYGLNTSSLNKFALGIYEHPDGKSTMIFPWGDSPGNGLKYYDVYGGKTVFENHIDSRKTYNATTNKYWITQDQADRIKDVYGENGPTNGKILQFNVFYETIVDDDADATQKFKNEAKITYSNTNTQTDSASAYYYSASGGAGLSFKDIEVEKTWAGYSPSDTHNPVTVRLYSNGEDTGKTIALNSSNNWKGKFENLFIYENGEIINYTVKEELTGNEDFEVSYDYTTPDKVKITNTNKTTAKIKVKAEKKWLGTNAWKTGKSGENIQVKVFDKDDPSKQAKDTFTLNQGNNWKGESTDLDKYKLDNGVYKLIDYGIEEIAPPNADFKPKIIQNQNKDFTIKNIQLKKIVVKKEWDPNAAPDWTGKMKDTAKVKIILSDGTTETSKIVDKNSNWTAEFIDLPVCDDEGNIINYTVKEKVIYEDGTEEDFVPKSVSKEDSETTTDFTIVNTVPSTTKATLTVNKKITGEGANPQDVFKFKANFYKENSPDEEDENAEYDYIKSDGTENKIRNNGEFELKGNEHITIKDLPNNIKYKLQEIDYGRYTPKDGVIRENTITTSSRLFYEETFVNERTTPGQLRIEKQVTGSGGDRTKKFRFVVTIGTDPNKEYDYTGSLTGKIKSGEAIELSHGQYVEIKGIEAGETYKVTEDNYSSDGYSTRVDGENKREKEGTIKSDLTESAVFVNNRNGGEEPPPDKPDKPNDNPPPDKPKEDPKTPPDKPKEDPKTPPTKPKEDPKTPPDKPNDNPPPETPPTPSIPSYPRDNPPDPNDPNSPESIVVVDENGVPLGTYTKRTNPDGTVEYVDEDGVPLGGVLVKTGNEFPENALIITSMVSLLGLVILRRYRRKDR